VERRKLICPLGLTFFGLTPEYRLNVFSIIHDIVFHGNGGYDWHTVYNMPIWLRKFTYNKIREHFQQINEESTPEPTKPKQQIARPNIKPNYSAKASK
jgi:hypothetical protein